MKRNKCVYEYRLPESEGGHTYYVGQGNYRRPYAPHPYSDFKDNACIKPTDKNQIIIIKKNLTEQEAKDLEIELIAKHGRLDIGEGYLLNRTAGGEGTNGYILSEETRRKLSEAQKGKKMSEESKRKMSEAHKGIKNPNFGKPHSKEHRRKISESGKGRIHSEESKRKMSEKASGRIRSEENKRNISKGKVKWYKTQPKIKCNHCSALHYKHLLDRWHNDNCKHKECVDLFDL